MPENRIIIIAGPTASGKSALAIDVALAVNGVVINCDSMQVYKGLTVLAACPTAADRQKVEHRLFEIFDSKVRGNVVDWLDRAVSEIKDIWAHHQIPVVVGGTGLYIDNLLNGVTPIPETPEKIRLEVKNFVKTMGLGALYQKVKEVDASSAARINPKDKTRLTRALEVWQDTGQKLSAWHKLPMVKSLPQARFTVIKICPEMAELEKCSAARFEQMIKSGALEEVKKLIANHLDSELPAMKALGVPELCAYIKGEVSLDEACDLVKLHTRQYAKRQRTWFKNKLKADLELPSCYRQNFAVVAQFLQAAGFETN